MTLCASITTAMSTIKQMSFALASNLCNTLFPGINCPVMRSFIAATALQNAVNGGKQLVVGASGGADIKSLFR